MKKNKDSLTPAPPDYKWPRCPEADAFVEARLEEFLGKHRFANQLSEKMLTQTSTLFSVWVDHLLLPMKSLRPQDLDAVGFVEEKRVARPSGARAFAHPFADLPRLLYSPRVREVSCAIMVEDIWAFALAHELPCEVAGAPLSGYREMIVPDDQSALVVVERRGSLDFVPVKKSRSHEYLYWFEKWVTRWRTFESAGDGMHETLLLARQISKALGTGAAAILFLEGERLFWQKRNRAAQIQKARQDALGLGWANHDHHTFRSSREHFPMLIEILLTFGFKKRERFYAGEEAGWGAQVMEQPEAGVIIFADVDLAPRDINVDFSKVALKALSKPNTVGLWCALHGESILEAGMHHLEAKFDFERLKKDLSTREVVTMNPFSDFPFLRQAFTKAEMWKVPEERLTRLVRAGWLGTEAAQKIRVEGAVGSHLENLQRREGFKGFNQRGVSDIIAAVNPEKQALGGSEKRGA